MQRRGSKGCGCGLTSAMTAAMRRSRTSRLPIPPTEEALSTLLTSFGVDVSLYGKGKAKPVGALFRELQACSCSLEVEKATKQLVRSVEPVFVQLTHDGKVLVEKAQVLPNGNRRDRNTLLAEKCEPNDDDNPVVAALRGIKEELHVEVYEGIDGLQHTSVEEDTFVEKMESASYPGILAVYTTHRVRLDIRAQSAAEELFKACGTIGSQAFETSEDQPDGTQHYFWEWIPVDEASDAGVKGFSYSQGQ